MHDVRPPQKAERPRAWRPKTGEAVTITKRGGGIVAQGRLDADLNIIDGRPAAFRIGGAAEDLLPSVVSSNQEGKKLVVVTKKGIFEINKETVH